MCLISAIITTFTANFKFLFHFLHTFLRAQKCNFGCFSNIFPEKSPKGKNFHFSFFRKNFLVGHVSTYFRPFKPKKKKSKNLTSLMTSLWRHMTLQNFLTPSITISSIVQIERAMNYCCISFSIVWIAWTKKGLLLLLVVVVLLRNSEIDDFWPWISRKPY